MPISYTLLPLLLLLQVAKPAIETDMDPKVFSNNVAKFAAKFCNELDKSKSSVSSPLSAEYVLALLSLGATEPAQTELLTTLGFPNKDAIRSSFTAVSGRVKSIKGVTLNVANKVYVKEGNYELEPQLEKDAVSVFDAAFEKVNFANSVAAADLINKWVESKTNNKIKDLLSSDSLSEDTRLVLVNAVYFKGTWSKKFDVSLTRDLPFHVNAKKTANVPMMYREDRYRYGESEALKAQLLELPYEGGEASMVVVLPKDVEGLNSVLQKLASGHDLIEEINQMYPIKVQVTLPKFKIETEIDLLTLLPKLGIKAIFNRGNSGLDNILNTKEPLFVSKAVQKAFIEVNEEGAEAAAATAMVAMVRCAMVDFNPVKQFVADRPFLAMILVERAPYFFASYHGN